MAWDPERHREYQRQRRRERLALARECLGGQCVRFGATENLQFDHIDGSTKVANISEITNWSLKRFLEEVDKCQLLCGPGSCHQDKTTEETYDTICSTGEGRWKCQCGYCAMWRSGYHAGYMKRSREEIKGMQLSRFEQLPDKEKDGGSSPPVPTIAE
jgi:hypothetical protein